MKKTAKKPTVKLIVKPINTATKAQLIWPMTVAKRQKWDS